jgi:hypothetical protein
MTKKAGYESESGSGSLSQRHGSADPDPDPHQTHVMEHCRQDTLCCHRAHQQVPEDILTGGLGSVLGVRIRIRMFLGLQDPDPDPLVRGTERDLTPNPSVPFLSFLK